MANTLSANPRARRHTSIKRVLIAVACAITAWHIFATFLWVAPVTAIRDIIPGGNATLTNYMIPFFGQSWSVFAPEPINGNYAFRVRAEVQKTDGTTEITDWIDAAAVDLSMSRDNLLPPRAANLGVQEASQFKDSYDALNGDHRIIVALNFTGPDWRNGLQEKLDSYGNDSDNVTKYMTQELYAVAYATQVAKATWGSNVVGVQFQASRQNIPSFADRNSPDIPAQPVQIAETGWRPAVVLPGQNERHFADTFRQNLRNLGVDR